MSTTLAEGLGGPGRWCLLAEQAASWCLLFPTGKSSKLSMRLLTLMPCLACLTVDPT